MNVKPFHLTPRCPTCDAEISRWSVDGQHCNQQYFETANYRCGAVYKFVPNFGKAEVDSHCPRSEVVRTKESRRRLINQAVAAKLNDLQATYTECADFARAMDLERYGTFKDEIWQHLPTPKVGER